MTAAGSPTPRTDRNRAASFGTVMLALLPLLTCGIGAPIAFGIAMARRRTLMTLIGLIVYTTAWLVAFGLAGIHGDQAPLWSDLVFWPCILIASLVSTAHLFVIRSAVWAPQRPVAGVRTGGPEAVDHARWLRRRARETAAADPMLAKRIGIGRPDLPRQVDDGGLIDLNHAPVRVLMTLPGMTEAGARQIRERVDRLGPFTSLGEVLLTVEISPSFEHHLSEYAVFIP